MREKTAIISGVRRILKFKAIVPVFVVVWAAAFAIAQTQSGSSATQNPSTSATKPVPDTTTQSRNPNAKKRVLRVGIAQVMSIVSTDLATDGWQQELMNNLDFLGAKGVILNADPNDRDATLEEAKQANCDYAIFTTVTTFKSVGVGEKIGSVLGRGGLGGVGGAGQGRVEIGAEVKVFQPDNPVPILDANNNFRQNDPKATATGLLHTEARDVMLQLRKLQANNEHTGTTNAASH
jgi:hypothetical protein